MIPQLLKKWCCVSAILVSASAFSAYAQMSFSGYVQDENGNRQADATVTLLCGGIQATTNANGEFSLQAAAVPQSGRYSSAIARGAVRYKIAGPSLVISNPLAGDVSLPFRTANMDSIPAWILFRGGRIYFKEIVITATADRAAPLR